MAPPTPSIATMPQVTLAPRLRGQPPASDQIEVDHSTKLQPMPITRIGGNPLIKKVISILSPNPLQSFKMEEHFTPLGTGTSHQRSLLCHQGPILGKAPEADPVQSHSPERKNTVLTTTARDTGPFTAEASRNILKNLSANASSKNTSLSRGQSLNARQSSAPSPTQSQHMITQY